MSGTTAAPGERLDKLDKAEQLPPDARQALRDLLLSLADGKRLLGIRYADWMLGAPTLESGIAASSMAQDEWGHARLTYALLGEFGDEPKTLEHEREAAAYRSPEAFDRPLASWAELIAASLLFDTAFSVQYHALVDSRYAPVHNRVQKMLDEERFHFQHAAGWTRRLAHADAVRDEFRAALERMLPAALRRLGRPDADGVRRLVEEGLVRDGPDMLRARFLASVGPVLHDAGFAEALRLKRQGAEWSYDGELSWEGWNDAARRAGGEGPDADTLGRVRGDKNRAFLMD
jgi:ring-1,2-phenylacetyl-CoA epoxidase subunit PaaC